MDEKTCNRAALGRSVQLGDFYDVRTDTLPTTSILRINSLPQEFVNIVDVNSTVVTKSHTKMKKEILHALNVDGELKMSLLAGALKLEAYGRYFDEMSKESESESMTLIYTIETQTTDFKVCSESVADIISLEAMKATSATHVVTSITWGGIAFCIVRHTKEDSSTSTSIKAELNVACDKLNAALNIKGNTDNSIAQGDERFEYFILGDFISEDKIPKCFPELQQMICDLPLRIQRANQGRGKPLKFTLLPIAEIAKMLPFEISISNKIQFLDLSFINDTEELFNDIDLVIPQLTLLKSIFEEFVDDGLSVNEFGQISTMLTKLKKLKGELRDCLKKVLFAIRSGKSYEDEAKRMWNIFETSTANPRKLKKQMEDFGPLKRKLKWISQAKKKHNISFEMSKQFNRKNVIDEKGRVFLFFSKTTESKLFEINYSLLIKLKTQYASSIFKIIELESNEVTEEDSFIEEYMDGKVVHPNVLSMNQVKITNKKYISVEFPSPTKLFIFYAPCPCNINANVPTIVSWNCAQCRTTMHHGLDGFLYCSCGRADMSKFEYKCSLAHHGITFLKFSPEYNLKEKIEKNQTLNEYNILLLGQTGVGKSTFINAFINYLRFDSLEEAKREDVSCCIPVSFMLSQPDGNKFKDTHIQFGDSNTEEISSLCESQTKTVRSYNVPIRDNTTVRIIDTPGIGDTRGMEYDRRNMVEVMNHIGRMPSKALHAICILLRPNETRLTAEFEFCFKELISLLHVSATKNICFVFTNSRITNYRLGETNAALSQLLSKINQNLGSSGIELSPQRSFFVDSESFRFLLALKRNIRFEKNEIQQFEASWNKSVKECEKLLDFVIACKPHNADETISIFQARQLIIKLETPMNETTKLIADQQFLVQCQIKKVNESNKNKTELEKVLFVPTLDLEIIKIDYPRTVCGKCIENVGGKIQYKMICHDKCYLTGIDRDTDNPAGIQNCAMTHDGKTFGNPCHVCKCPYQNHRHIYYDTKIITKNIKDENIAMQLKTETGRALAVQQTLEACKSRLQELQVESDAIIKAFAIFSVFLKKNAILLYNDSFKRYMQLLIENAKREQHLDGGSNEKRNVFEQMLQRFVEQESALLKATNREYDEAPITLERVNKTVKELYNLKNVGKSLKGQYLENVAAMQKERKMNDEISVEIGSYSKRTFAYCKRWAQNAIKEIFYRRN